MEAQHELATRWLAGTLAPPFWCRFMESGRVQADLLSNHEPVQERHPSPRPSPIRWARETVRTRLGEAARPISPQGVRWFPSPVGRVGRERARVRVPLPPIFQSQGLFPKRGSWKGRKVSDPNQDLTV